MKENNQHVLPVPVNNEAERQWQDMKYDEQKTVSER